MGALIDLPLTLPVIVGWGAWLAAGLALVMWARHAHEARLMAAAQQSAARNIPARPRSSVRPPRPATPPADAFGELQALLDPPQSVAQRPGD